MISSSNGIGWWEWNGTSTTNDIIEDWIDGDNYGITIYTKYYNDKVVRFRSPHSEVSFSQRPKLDITYNLPPIGDLIVQSNQLSPSGLLVAGYRIRRSRTC